MKNIFLKIFFIMVIIISSFNITLAKDIESLKEVVFVIDASNSMKSFDKKNLVTDEIKKITNFLTSDYKVGVVIYNTSIVNFAHISNDLSYVNSILDSIQYTGYTNAGEVLDFAISMFSESAYFKNIIMVSDGEIVLQNENLTNESNNKFKNAIKVATQKDISIDIIALGELTKDGEKFNIFKASELTGGQVFKCSNILKLNEISNEILFNKFKIKKSQVGVFGVAFR